MEAETCCVCLEEIVFRGGKEFVTSPGCCGKFFHQSCLQQLILAKKMFCPACMVPFASNPTILQKGDPVAEIPIGVPIRFRCVQSNLVLDVDGGGMTDGSFIIQWSQHNQLNQTFIIEPLENADGVYLIKCAHSNKYWDIILGGAFQNGTPLIQYRKNAQPNQQFRFDKCSEDTLCIVSVVSGKCLDVVGGSTLPGTKIVQYRRNGRLNQQFRIERI